MLCATGGSLLDRDCSGGQRELPSTAAAPSLGSQGGSSVGSRNAADSALWRSAKVSSVLPLQKDDGRDYPMIIRWEMREIGEAHTVGAQRCS